MGKQVKQKIVDEIASSFKGMDGAILVDFTGVDSEKTYQLRRLLNDRKVEMQVVKDSLAARAFDRLGYRDTEKLLKGPTAVAYGKDSVQVAKTIVEWRKKNKDKLLPLKGGLLAGRTLTPAEVEQLAQTPDKRVLLAQLVGLLASPLSGFVGALGGILRKPLYALNAVVEQKEKQGGAAQGGMPPAA